MANADKVCGLRPVGTLGQSEYTGKSIPCYKAAGTTVTHDLAIGDAVKLSGTGGSVGDRFAGLPQVEKAAAGDTAAAGDAIFGIVTGFQFLSNHLDRKFVDGADEAIVMVDADKSTIYEAQADGAMEVNDIGLNTNLVQTSAVNRVTGASGLEVDADATTDASYQLLVYGFPQRPDNEINEENNKVLVVINEGQWSPGVIGA